MIEAAVRSIVNGIIRSQSFAGDAAAAMADAGVTEEVKKPLSPGMELAGAGDPEKAAPPPAAVQYRGWRAMPYVIGNETFEKLGTLGTSANLLVYLSSVFHLKSNAAATVINVVNGSTNMAPIIGAFVSDAFLGRYATLGYASLSSLVGMIILTLTAGIPSFHPPSCTDTAAGATICAAATPWQLALLTSSFVFLMIGAGGIRSCNLAFGADQFDPATESGRRGTDSFFNWYYFTFTAAMMVSATLVVYVQSNVSWTIGLGIPTLLMFLSCVLFFAGTRIYVIVRPQGSPFTGIAQVIAAAFRKRRLPAPTDSERSLFNGGGGVGGTRVSYTRQFRFLDKACVVAAGDEIKPDGTPADPWRLCSVQQAEVVKSLLRIVPIWTANVIYSVAITQTYTYAVFQSLQSDRRLTTRSSFRIPAGSFFVFSMLALTVWVAIYDRLIVPRLRRLTGREGGITQLQRQGIGIAIAVLAMLVAAAVEVRRRRLALLHGTAPPGGAGPGAVSPMSGLWLVPQLAMLGVSEGFNSVGQIEFYYKEFPENMRSVAGSMFYLAIAVSNYLSSLMITLVHGATGRGKDGINWLPSDLNRGRLDYFFYLIAAIELANLVFFLAFARWYKYKTPEATEMAAAEGTEMSKASSGKSA